MELQICIWSYLRFQKKKAHTKQETQWICFSDLSPPWPRAYNVFISSLTRTWKPDKDMKSLIIAGPSTTFSPPSFCEQGVYRCDNFKSHYQFPWFSRREATAEPSSHSLRRRQHSAFTPTLGEETETQRCANEALI